MSISKPAPDSERPFELERLVFFSDAVFAIAITLLILFFVALMPYSTSIMGEYGNIAAGLWLYAFNMFFPGLSGASLWNHATHKHQLVDPKLDDTFIRSVLVRAFTTPAAAVIVFALSFFIGSFANFGWSLIYLFQILVIHYYKQPIL